jgi:hypothetical protein
VILKERGVGGEVGVPCLGAAVRGAFIAILAYTIRLDLSRDKVLISSFEPWLDPIPENGAPGFGFGFPA